MINQFVVTEQIKIILKEESKRWDNGGIHVGGFCFTSVNGSLAAPLSERLLEAVMNVDDEPMVEDDDDDEDDGHGIFSHELVFVFESLSGDEFRYLTERVFHMGDIHIVGGRAGHQAHGPVIGVAGYVDPRQENWNLG